MDQLTANKYLICGLCDKCHSGLCAGVGYEEFCDLEDFHPCDQLLPLIDQLLE